MKTTDKKMRALNGTQDKSLIIIRNVVRVFLIIWTILIIFPLVWTVISSLKKPTEFIQSAWGFPKELQWGNYKKAWEEADFSKYFLNSIILSAGTVFITVLMTATSSFVIAKFVSPVIKSIEKFYALFMMVPQILLLIPLLKLCENLNLLNGGMVLPTLMITNALQGVPFYVFLLTPFMKGINNAVLEAAEIDGASQFRIFSALIVPMAIPAILMVGLLSFVGIWNEYVMSITFMGEDNRAFYTLSVGLNSLMVDNNFGNTVKFAALVLAMIPILIVYAIFQKPLQNGLSSSDGVKG